ncbi:MAG TPA: TetR/AcrR family transcriptional regulator [Actinocrinis sp.]|nr:TetR/AcrR family transcriptional regulator [Actinocrinis sp.]
MTTTPSDQSTRRPGRPRSEQAETAILDAVLGLFAAEVGYDDMSMEMIAAAAGVGKATIYRRWPNKEALVVDAIKKRVHAESEEVEDALARLLSLSSRDALIRLLEGMRQHMQDQEAGGVYAVLMRETRAKSQLWARYNTQVVEPRRDLFRQVLRRGRETGELRADLDVERTMVMLTSTMIFQTRMCPPGTPSMTGQFCIDLVDDFLRGGAARPGG